LSRTKLDEPLTFVELEKLSSTGPGYRQTCYQRYRSPLW
jgi:hypothetical protein